jgi:subtilisin family serine protease
MSIFAKLPIPLFFLIVFLSLPIANTTDIALAGDADLPAIAQASPAQPRLPLTQILPSPGKPPVPPRAEKSASAQPVSPKVELAKIDDERKRTGLAPLLTHNVAKPGTGGPVEHVVMFVSGVKGEEADAMSRQIADRLGIRAIAPFSGPLINGFTAKLDAPTIDRLRRESAVRYIEESLPIVPHETMNPTPSWGQDRIDQQLGLNNELNYGWIERPVRIYVMDSGIYSQHSNHGSARFHPGKCLLTSCNTPADSLVDGFGHGTHIAGTIGGTMYGVTRDVDIYSVKIADDIGKTDTATLLNGMNFIAQEAQALQTAQQGWPRVIMNLSYGVLGGTSVAIDSAVQDLVLTHGVTVVVSAGNEGVDACQRSPSRVPDIIVAGATVKPGSSWWPGDMPHPHSNWGACVSVYAPGYDILSSGIAGPDDAVFKDGTSMAAPHVAGVAALYVSRNLTPQAVKAQLIADGSLVVLTGYWTPMLRLRGMPPGNAQGQLLATSGGNPMFGVKYDWQLFIVWKDPADDLLKVANVNSVLMMPGSLTLGAGGDDVWGVSPDGNLVHAFWGPNGWDSEVVQMGGVIADPNSLIRTGSGNPLFGIKREWFSNATVGQVFIVWRDTVSNTWQVGNIRDIQARFGTLRLAADGSLFGVHADGNIFRAWWDGQFWEVAINVW